MINVLFVCMGNICRSPTAEGVFRHLIRSRNLDSKFHIDSAGTIDYHTGESPDPRAQQTALKFGIDMRPQTARQVLIGDFERFDYILVMDSENRHDLGQLFPDISLENVGLFCDFALNHEESEVPDPYYGGPHGFDHVFSLVQDASEGLLNSILKDHMPEHLRESL